MSLGAKLLTGFPIVTGATAYPMAVVIKNGGLKVEVPPSPPAKVPAPMPIAGPAQARESLQKLFDEGYRDCTPVKGYRGPGASMLYVCSFMNKHGSWSPSFFYFDRKDTDRLPKERFRKVTYISTKLGNRVMRFEDGGSIGFKDSWYPFWMSRMGGELKPEEECRFEKKGANNTLICKQHTMNQNEQQSH